MKIKGMIALLLGLGFGVSAQELPGTRMTLKLDGVSLAEAAKQISQASGNPTKVEIAESGGESLKKLFGLAPVKRTTLEAKDRLYWSVIEEMCEKNNLKLAGWSSTGESQTLLIQGEGHKRPTLISGGFMAQITRVEVQMDRDFRSEPNRKITLDVTMVFEPKLGIIKIAKAPDIEQATSADGVSLARETKKKEDPEFTDLVIPSMQPVRFELDYKPGVQSLKKLSGKIWVIEEAKSEDWVVDTDKAVGATKTVCDLDTLRIVGLRKEDRVIQMDLEITSNSTKENLVSTREFAHRVRYEGPAGRPEMRAYNINSSTTSRGGRTFQRCTIHLIPTSGEVWMPDKIIFRVPSEVKAWQVPFEFKDVELP